MYHGSHPFFPHRARIYLFSLPYSISLYEYTSTYLLVLWMTRELFQDSATSEIAIFVHIFGEYPKKNVYTSWDLNICLGLKLLNAT